MKKPQLIVLVVASLVAVVLVVVLMRQRPEPPPQQPGMVAKPKIPERPSQIVWPQLPAPVTERPRALPREMLDLGEGLEPQPGVRIPPGMILAVVNGKPLTLADVVALTREQAAQEQTLSVAMYEQMLERAIERELVLQAAAALGMELTPEQTKAIEDIKAKMMAPEPHLVERLTMSPERVEFEARDLKAQLLRDAMAAQYGVRSPHVNEADVAAYYNANRAEYGELPDDPAARRAAWERINAEIRMKLLGDVRNQHQLELRGFMEELKSGANILAP